MPEGDDRTLTVGYAISWSHDWVAGPNMGSAFVVALDEIERRQLLPGFVSSVFMDVHVSVHFESEAMAGREHTAKGSKTTDIKIA